MHFLRAREKKCHAAGERLLQKFASAQQLRGVHWMVLILMINSAHQIAAVGPESGFELLDGGLFFALQFFEIA